MGNMEVDEKRLVFEKSAKEACDGAHALVVLTEWDEFKTYPYHELYATMFEAGIPLRWAWDLESRGARRRRIRGARHRQGTRPRWPLACPRQGLSGWAGNSSACAGSCAEVMSLAADRVNPHCH